MVAAGSAEGGLLLVFPPLVISGFGTYYPSTAVLSAHLNRLGILNTQVCLNNKLVRFISGSGLTPDAFPGISEVCEAEIVQTAAAASALFRNIRARGGDTAWLSLKSSDRLTWSNILRHIFKPVHVDAAIEDICERVVREDPICKYYMTFYASDPSLTQAIESAPCVGISIAMGPQLLPAMLFSKWVRSVNPSARVVIGGPAISLLDPRELALLQTRVPYWDVAVRFEGENAIADLAAQLRSNSWCPSAISNACFVEERGGLTETPPKPGPPLDLLPCANFQSDIVQEIAATELGITEARGCYWGQCSYCDYVELYHGSKPYRSRSAAAIVREMQFQHDTHGISHFTLITEALAPSAARKLVEEIDKAALTITWSSFVMVHSGFDRSLLRRMVKSGCVSVVVGMESMTTRVLRLVKKWADQEANEQFLQAAKGAGLKLTINLIPDLPTTTFSEAMASLEAVRRNAQAIETLSVFPFEATKSSELGRFPERFGLSAKPSAGASRQAQYESNHLSVSDEAMSSEERDQVLAAFKDFSSTHNASRVLDRPCHSDHFELAEERFIVRGYGGTTRLINFFTQKDIEISRGLDLMIKILRTEGPITRSALMPFLGTESRCDRFIDELYSMGLIRKRKGGTSLAIAL